MVSRELKELVDNMCDAVETLGVQGGLEAGVGNAARMELGMFMMYLSASDGTIEWDEAKVISEICNLNIAPSELGNFIRENNIYSTEFEAKVPVTFQLMVAGDNKLAELGIELSGSDAMLETYKAIGEALIKSDGNVSDNEISDYKIYINMLEEYRDKNISSRKNGVSGFAKNGSSSISAPFKSGVAAPRKG